MRRRVVTGHDADGKAVFASDMDVDGFRSPLTPGSEFHWLWGGDETSRFPTTAHYRRRDALPGRRLPLPPVHRATERCADRRSPTQSRRGLKPGGGAAGRDMAYMEPDVSGMHTTDTIDFEIVLEGEVWLEPTTAPKCTCGRVTPSSRTARAMRGAIHGDAPARLAVPIVGAPRTRRDAGPDVSRAGTAGGRCWRG